MRQIILDTETTGLMPEAGHRIIEIGCVELVNRRLTGNNRHYYVNPERDSDPDALKVHGISNEFLLDKPKFSAIAQELLDYCAGAEIIIHNAPFDLGFLNKELERSKRPAFTQAVATVVDTLSLAKELYPGKRNSLDALCDRLEVDRANRSLHGALLDAELLAQVYIRLTRGQDALLIDHPDDSVQGAIRVPLDLRGFDLPVLYANAQELQAHAAQLDELDKASSGKTRWRQVPAREEAGTPLPA